jgi:hypothetical protein
MRNSFITAAMAAVFVFVATDVGHAKKYNQSSTSNSSAQKKRDDAYKEKARKHSRPYSYNALRAAERYRGRWHNKVT